MRLIPLERARKFAVSVEQTPRMIPEDCGEPTDLVAAAVRDVIPDDGQEHLVAVAMDAHGKPLGVALVATGTVDNCPLNPRDVFAYALGFVACRYVGVAHNHPSGDVTPSGPDATGSAALAFAGKIVGFDVLWSLVVTHAGDQWRQVEWQNRRKRNERDRDDAPPEQPQDPEPEPESESESEPEPQEQPEPDEESEDEAPEPSDDSEPEAPEPDDTDESESEDDTDAPEVDGDVDSPDGDAEASHLEPTHSEATQDELRASLRRVFGVK